MYHLQADYRLNPLRGEPPAEPDFTTLATFTHHAAAMEAVAELKREDRAHNLRGWHYRVKFISEAE